MAKCGNCGKADATVAEIRECFAATFGRDMGELTAANVSVTESAVIVAPVEITEGFWTLDSSIYKVQRAVHGSGRLYAKILDVGPGVDGAPEASWHYAPGAFQRLGREGAHKLTREEAAEFGKLYGVCCICGRTLTNEESIAAGIGPICAGKQGW